MENGRGSMEGSEAPDGKGLFFRLGPFSALPEPSREALLEIGEPERLRKRRRILEQGELAKSMLVLGSGRVRLDRLHGERLVAVGHRGPGETIGEAAVAGFGASAESAVVADDCDALVLPLASLRKLLGSDQAVRIAMTAVLVERFAASQARLESLLLRRVEGRLADFLARAADRWGQPHASGQLVAAAFTHADIARLIGSTRETVTLLIGKLRRAGLLELAGRRVVVRDRAALERLAAGPPQP